MTSLLVLLASLLGSADETKLPYPIVDTNQAEYYGLRGGTISTPDDKDPMRMQDAGHTRNAPSYRDNGDGTVSDLVTGLSWQKAPDRGAKQTFADAQAGASACRTGGFADWRLPTIKELYSLVDFSGGMALSPRKPYLDTRVFEFQYGDTAKGERDIDSQWWSSTQYVGTTMRGSATVFGVNFADGRIKGYPRDHGPRGVAKQWVRYVRGNPRYGTNDFHDLGIGVVEDRATGLQWAKADAGKPMDWPSALAFAAAAEIGGHSDWRLPNAKELQSIVDYTRSPALTGERKGAAIDPVFTVTDPETYYWTSTTHLDDRGKDGPGGAAVYVCFGRAMGWMGARGPQGEGRPPRPGREDGGERRPPPPGAESGGEKQLIDVHGAGAQRSDPKTGDPSRFPQGRGPQGDDVRILNGVRLVRG